MEIPYEFEAETVVKEGRTTRSAIEALRNWLPTANFPQLSDETLTLFLLSCENDLDATKDTVRAYFKCRKSAPEMFDERDVDREDLQKAMNTVIASSIPVRMENNHVIHYFRLQDTNYSNFDLVPAMKIAYMIVDISQRRDPPSGLVVLMDMKGLGLMHLTKMKVGAIRKFLQYLQEGMPLKLKAIHILNSNYLFDKILDLIRVFMKSELIQQLKMYPVGYDMEVFAREHIPFKCLPKEYGGSLPTAEELNQVTIQQFRELKPFFEIEEKMRKTNEM